MNNNTEQIQNDEICTYTEYMPENRYIVPVAYKRFCLTNKHSLLDGTRHDIDIDALGRACSQIPSIVTKIHSLNELPHPKINEKANTIEWLLFRNEHYSKGLPYYAQGQYCIHYDATNGIFTAKLFWNESINIKHAFKTHATGFESQTEIIKFLNRARSWGKISWTRQNAINKSLTESYNLTQKEIVAQMLGDTL